MIHMNTNELTELLMMIDEMSTLTRVVVSLGDVTIEVDRTTGSHTAPAEPTQVEQVQPVAPAKPTQPATTAPAFAPASTSSGFGSPPAHPLQTNLATEGQRKYADDLANKLGTGDMMNVVNGLAHALEVPADDILHPSEWATRLSREQADAYLDVLEREWGKHKSRGGWS